MKFSYQIRLCFFLLISFGNLGEGFAGIGLREKSQTDYSIAEFNRDIGGKWYKIHDLIDSKVPESKKVEILKQSIPLLDSGYDLIRVEEDLKDAPLLNQQSKEVLLKQVRETIRSSLSGDLSTSIATEYFEETLSSQIGNKNSSEGEFEKKLKELETLGLNRDNPRQMEELMSGSACSFVRTIRSVGRNGFGLGEEDVTGKYAEASGEYLVKALTNLDRIIGFGGSNLCESEVTVDGITETRYDTADDLIHNMVNAQIEKLKNGPMASKTEDLVGRLRKIDDQLRARSSARNLKSKLNGREHDYLLAEDNRLSLVKIESPTDCALADVEEYICLKANNWKPSRRDCGISQPANQVNDESSRLFGEEFSPSGGKRKCNVWLTVQSSPISSFKKPESSEVKCSGATKLYHLSK